MLGETQAQTEQGINATDVMLGGAGLGGAAFFQQTGRAPAPAMTPKLSKFAQQVAANDAARTTRPVLVGQGTATSPFTQGRPVPGTMLSTTNPLATTSSGVPATRVPTGTAGRIPPGGRIPTGPVIDAKLIKPGAGRALLGRAGLLGATAVGSYTAAQAADEKYGLSDKIANFLTDGLYNRGMAGERGLTAQERDLIAEGINPATGTRVGPFEEVITQEDRFDPIRSVATLNDEIRLERESGAQEQINPQQLAEIESYLANEGQPQISPGFNAMSVEDTRAKLLEEFGAPTISKIQAQDEARRLAQQDPAFQDASAAREARIDSRPDFMEAVSDADRRAQATGGGAASMSDADRRKLAKGLRKGASASEQADALKVQQQYGLGDFKPERTESEEAYLQRRTDLINAQINKLQSENPDKVAAAQAVVDKLPISDELKKLALLDALGLGQTSAALAGEIALTLPNTTPTLTITNDDDKVNAVLEKNPGFSRDEVIDELKQKGKISDTYTSIMIGGLM